MTEVIAEPQLEVSPCVALVSGEPYIELPKDLYIPPEAMRVFLSAFEGPLDLLLYLIRQQDLDILDIPVAKITEQYMGYIEMMHSLEVELAADYLVMAATLAEIKSRLLLPKPETTEEEEDDPRADLIRRLQEYERFKNAAERIDEMPRLGREIFSTQADKPDMKLTTPPPSVELDELYRALHDVLSRMEMNASHTVQKESLSIRQKMSMVLHRLQEVEFAEFTNLIEKEEGRLGVVVTFVALLELLKQSLIELVQAKPFSPIHVKAKVS